MRFWHSMRLAVAGLAIVVVCASMATNAQAAVCRLDWNGDYQIALDDYNNEAEIGGFYAEWYLFLYTPYYPVFFPGADSSRLDYNGDGLIDTDDLMGTLDAAVETEGFYSEWYIFMYTQYYPIFFPEYDVCPPLPPAGECPALDYIDVGGPNAWGEPNFFTPLGGKLYFTATTEVAMGLLYVYDPVTGLAELVPGTETQNCRDLIAHQGKLYYQGTDTGWDTELYVFDPATGAETKIDLHPTADGMPTDFFSASNGLLYFRAREGAGNDQELWEYDPVTGLWVIYEIFPGTDFFGQPNRGVPSYMVEHDGRIYMRAYSPEGLELHSFDLATKQIDRLTNVAPGYTETGAGLGCNLTAIAVFNNEIFFTASSEGDFNTELWIYNPVTGGLREKVIDDGQNVFQGSLVEAGGGPSDFTELGGKLYMRAQQVPVGVELFVYDPATDAVTLEFDSYPGQYEYCGGPVGTPPCLTYGNDGHTAELTRRGDKLYFVSSFDNQELWEYDPVTGVGQQLFEIFPGLDEWGAEGQGAPFDITEMDGNLYFQATSSDVIVEEFFMVTWSAENCP